MDFFKIGEDREEPAARADQENFQELSLEANQDREIYLDGALKISRSTCTSRFDFRGKIAQTTDFEDITSYLMSEKNMVQIFFS